MPESRFQLRLHEWQRRLRVEVQGSPEQHHACKPFAPTQLITAFFQLLNAIPSIAQGTSLGLERDLVRLRHVGKNRKLSRTA